MPLFRFQRNAKGARVQVQIDERGSTIRTVPSPTPVADAEAAARASVTRSDPNLEKLLLGDQDEGIEGEQEEGDGHPAPLPPATAAVSVAQPSVALQDIMAQLHTESVGWAETRVGRLDSLAELDRAEQLERDHPASKGGRPKVMRAIQAKRMRLSTPADL